MWLEYLVIGSWHWAAFWIAIIVTLLLDAVAGAFFTPPPSHHEDDLDAPYRRREQGIIPTLRLILIATVVVPTIVYLFFELGLLDDIKFGAELEP